MIISVLVAFASTMPGAKRVDLFFVPAKNDPMAAMPSAMPAWPFLAIACPTCSAEHESMAR